MCWHKWGKWTDFAVGKLTQQFSPVTGMKLDEHEQYETGYFEAQKRVCEKCGQSQLRKVHT